MFVVFDMRKIVSWKALILSYSDVPGRKSSSSPRYVMPEEWVGKLDIARFYVRNEE